MKTCSAFDIKTSIVNFNSSYSVVFQDGLSNSYLKAHAFSPFKIQCEKINGIQDGVIAIQTDPSVTLIDLTCENSSVPDSIFHCLKMTYVIDANTIPANYSGILVTCYLVTLEIDENKDTKFFNRICNKLFYFKENLFPIFISLNIFCNF